MPVLSRAPGKGGCMGFLKGKKQGKKKKIFLHISVEFLLGYLFQIQKKVNK